MDTQRQEHELSVLQDRGIDIDTVVQKLANFRIEVPSWGFMDTGTRFGAFPQPGIPQNLSGRIDGLVEIKRRTGVADRLATIYPWDYQDTTPLEIKEYAEASGVSIGSVTPVLFQDPDFMLGSLTNPFEKVRRKAIETVLLAIETARDAGAGILSLWVPDGSDYPGQVDFRRRKQHLLVALEEIYSALGDDLTLLLEYKLFEPAFYHTDIPDWGTAFAYCQKLGEKASVLVDLGHHAHSVNIEQIVAFLNDEGKLGGFHFNNRKYADDDLTVSSINPFEVFLILCEIVTGWERKNTSDIYFGIDQSSGVKPKMGALLQSIDSVHRALAKALIVDRERLRKYQEEGNVIGAEECLREAFETNVSALLSAARQRMGCPSQVLDEYLMQDPRVTGNNY